MQITQQYHIKATEKREGYFAIPELDRHKSSVQQFIALSGIAPIKLTQATAFLYVDGFTTSQAEAGIGNAPNKFQVALKTGSSYIAHEWVNQFENKHYLKHVNIITSTCAAGIQAVWEAQRLLDSGVCREVIIIGGERITEGTLRLFKELRIPVICGDGFVFLRLVDKGAQIHDIKWKYAYNENPFAFTKDTLNSLLPFYPVGYVKLHGTGSEANTEAEADLAEFATPLSYKQDIGHTQGISSLLETCIVLADDSIEGKVLITANGLGGFYGAFTLNK